MNASLDDMLDQLAQAPEDADFGALEGRTLRRIAKIRRARALETWLLPARASAIVLALSLGAAMGVAHARDSSGRPEVAVFEVASAYAPSTLLDH